MKLGVTENAHLLGHRDGATGARFAREVCRRVIAGATPDVLTQVPRSSARLAHLVAPPDVSDLVAALDVLCTRHLTADGSLFVVCSPANASAVRRVLDGAFGPTAFRGEVILVGGERRPELSDRHWTTHHAILFIYSQEGGAHWFDAAEARRSGARGSVWELDGASLYRRLIKVHSQPGDVVLSLAGEASFARAAAGADRGFVLATADEAAAVAVAAALEGLSPERANFSAESALNPPSKRK